MEMKKLTSNLVENVKYLKKLGYETNWVYSPSKENTTRTQCIIKKDDEIHEGLAVRNAKDSYNLKLARHISFQRAIRDINAF